jgi:hypothetical protein
VVQLVGDDGVFRVEQGFEEAAVGVEAGAVEDGVVHAEEIAQALFQLLVDRLGAADEADAGEAIAPSVERFAGGGDDFWVVCEAEVVIGA